MMDSKKILWYLGIVFILSYGWQYIIYVTGGVDSGLFPILMLFPGIVAVFFILVTKAGFRKIGWGLKKWQYIFPSVFIPLAVSLGLVYLIGALKLGTAAEDLFVFSGGRLESTKIGLLFGSEDQTIPFFIFNLTASHIVFLATGSLLTLGEELGWRGYLQEKMLRKFGMIRGFAILGAIWGYWHLPVILMGYNFPDNPWLGGLVLMPVGTIFLGVFLGWLYLRSRSIWMPALAHASANLFSGLLFGMKMNREDLTLQLFWIGAWGLVAVLCMISLMRNKPDFWQGQGAATDGAA